jgi:hypothetical protein
MALLQTGFPVHCLIHKSTMREGLIIFFDPIFRKENLNSLRSSNLSNVTQLVRNTWTCVRFLAPNRCKPVVYRQQSLVIPSSMRQRRFTERAGEESQASRGFCFILPEMFMSQVKKLHSNQPKHKDLSTCEFGSS